MDTSTLVDQWFDMQAVVIAGVVGLFVFFMDVARRWHEARGKQDAPPASGPAATGGAPSPGAPDATAGTARPYGRSSFVVAGAAVLLVLAVTAIGVYFIQPTYELRLEVVDQGDLVPRTLQSERFAGRDARALKNTGSQQPGPWLIAWMEGNVPPSREPIPFRVVIPADLTTEPPVFTGLESHRYRLSIEANGEIEPTDGLNDPDLAEIGQNFHLVVELVGYSATAIPVRWGERLEGDFYLLPRRLGRIQIVVEVFQGDQQDLGGHVVEHLSDVGRWVIVTRHDLDAKIAEVQVSGKNNPRLLTQMLDELKVDLSVRGTVTTA